MSNAHASSTPHHVGQIAKAEILVAHLLDTTPPGTDTARQAKVIVEQLQTAGWTAPPDPNADIPPLRPAHVGDHRPHIEHIRAVLADPHHPDRAPRLDT